MGLPASQGFGGEARAPQDQRTDFSVEELG
jgi:hypothetical protein